MNNNKADNSIELRNICSISGHNFYIPDYQRGYRWTPTQALQMLHDFLEFIDPNSKNKQDKFYCLQPIVVKPKSWTDKEGNPVEGYEVIDGQQRLTTIYLLLSALKTIDDRNLPTEDKFRMFNIYYQTRDDSQEFLKRISKDSFREEKAYDFIDFYHMRMVYNALLEEMRRANNHFDRRLSELILMDDFRPFKDDDDDDDDDAEAPLVDMAHNVRVIWYCIGDNEKATSEDIFTRLNIGKIPLTNAELIKAMFLKESNFGKVTARTDKEIKAQQLGIALQQNKIAEEWNVIEQKLQRDDFWYFLGGGLQEKEYETRIEFVFDLIARSSHESEHYHTFNYFQDRLNKISKGRAAEIVWKEVKEYFRELEYWYNDRILFHLIGFLIECGRSIAYIKGLSTHIEKTETGEVKEVKLKKDEFLNAIKEEVKSEMQNVDYHKIAYGDKAMKKLLLLFNIVTVIENERSDVKFPFDKYKKENWDKEHIASQTNKDRAEVPNDGKDRIAWINDMVYYFTGIRGKDMKDAKGRSLKEDAEIDAAVLSALLAYIQDEKEMRDAEREIIKGLARAKQLSMKTSKQRNQSEKTEYEDLLQKLFEHTRDFFQDHKMQEDDKQHLGNMALLNATINRSYGNAFFAIKRMHIQDYDSEGVFIPLATKNVFMKYYSKRVDNMLTWTIDDAEAYAAAIEKKISSFLS